MASTMKKIYAMLGAVFALFGASLFAENGKIEILDLVMLFDENVERQAQDLKKMSAEKVADVHMISFFLVPEGNPPFDKISLYEDKYRRLRAAIGDADCKTGIILQATLGHGFELEVPHPFQKMVSRENGREAWMKNIVCPLDENFRKYVRDCVVRIAKLKPCVIMVDDDFRIMGGRNGCLCPLHLAKIKKEFGYDLTREQLKKHLRGNSESDRKISDAAMKVNGESLIELAKIIREAIDSVDPSIQCLMCGSPDDMLHDGDIARALAAKGMPATLRIGNARYYNPKYRDLYHTARQLAVQNAIAKPDRVYAEIDTYPRNRYFTSARTLHAGLVVSILEGATGAKYWPNRFVDYEPDSGIEYKKILAENRDAYDTLAAEMKNAKYAGLSEIVIPAPKTLRHDSALLMGDACFWSQITGVMGLPVSYSEISKLDRPALVRGRTAAALSDEQIKKILALGCVLDGDAAMEFQKRGFGKYLGVKISPWDKNVKITRERFGKNCGKIGGIVCEPPANPFKLETASDKTVVFSDFIHLPYTYGDKKLAEYLAPASTYFENELGGKVVVFASRPEGPNHLTESRKAQYIKLFNMIAPYSVWYDGDAEVYLKNASLKDGGELVAFTNVGLDPISPLTLSSTKKFSSAKILKRNGQWDSIDFKQKENGDISVDIRAEIYDPVILKFIK